MSFQPKINQHPLSKKEAKEKLARYCAYQERCHSEVREKLFSLKFFGEEADELISELITENFINEERFAKTFAGGKFRLKNWGRIKIVSELKRRDISSYCIDKAVKEIRDDDYLDTIKKLILTKSNYLHEPDLFIKRSKIAKYLVSKGFESSVIWPTIIEEIEDK